MNWNAAALVIGVIAMVYGLVMRFLIWPRARWANLANVANCVTTAIDLRSPDDAGIARRSAHIAYQAAPLVGIFGEKREQLRLGGLLSDIGLAAVPRVALVSGTREPVRAVVEGRHPEIGGAMLELVPGAGQVAELVRHHHRDDAELDEYALLQIATAYSVRAARAGEAAARDELTIRRGDPWDSVIVDAVLAVVPHV